MPPVTNLRRIFTFPLYDTESALAYAWNQPYSLDVTNALNPDITYCVKVYRFSCRSATLSENNESDLVVINSTCNVTGESIIIKEQVNTNKLYGIEVLPRINLDEAPNGTRNFYRGKFPIIL